jgi:hypothetical protein
MRVEQPMKQEAYLSRAWFACAVFALCAGLGCEPPPATPTTTVLPEPPALPTAPEQEIIPMSASAWSIHTDGQTTARLEQDPAKPEALVVPFRLQGGWGFVELMQDLPRRPDAETPLVLDVACDAGTALEFKFTDADGSVFGYRMKPPAAGRPTRVVLYWNNFEYWWGGQNDTFDEPRTLALAVAGAGSGTLRFERVGFGPPGLPATAAPAGPLLDPDRNLPGVGIRQRRAAAMTPEHPLVLEWLRQAQDASLPDRRLVGNSAGENMYQTFNNALVAMAFILKGERERAERILDFFAEATEPDNTDPRRQNFFLRGEPRGFFQNAVAEIRDGTTTYREPGGSDRWMGDMAWLLLAVEHHRQAFQSDRYDRLRRLLLDLLISFYRDAPDGPGGYVQHGWRDSDARLHEDHGHPEGNIDCYAVFRLCGRVDLAGRVRTWLDRAIKGRNLPLDLYTWRVLAYGAAAAPLLDIPEHDLRYRKTLIRDGRPAVGFYHGPDPDVNNIWLDGLGHIACAYVTLGDRSRGYFYANQLDAFLIEEHINGKAVRTLPYTATQDGAYGWVDVNRGFVSVGAWYLFAKNGFNPLALTTTPAADSMAR